MKSPTSTKTRGKRANAATPAAPAATQTRGSRSSRNNPNGGAPAQIDQPASVIPSQASKKRIATMKQSLSIARKMGEALAKQVEQNITLVEMLEAEQKQLEAA